jgi:hypothetical protein
MPLAAVRPDDWNFPLLLHVLGAMVLVGSLVTVVGALIISWRRSGSPEEATLNRLAFRTLLLVALPSFVVMRVFAQWVASKENVEDADFAWIGIGYGTSDGGLIVLVITLIVAYLGTRRLRREGGGGRNFFRAVAVLSSLMLVAYLVAMWAMTTKPI